MLKKIRRKLWRLTNVYRPTYESNLYRGVKCVENDRMFPEFIFAHTDAPALVIFLSSTIRRRRRRSRRSQDVPAYRRHYASIILTDSFRVFVNECYLLRCQLCFVTIAQSEGDSLFHSWTSGQLFSKTNLTR